VREGGKMKEDKNKNKNKNKKGKEVWRGNDQE
jgi:hypothetical protein